MRKQRKTLRVHFFLPHPVVTEIHQSVKQVKPNNSDLSTSGNGRR